MGWYSNVPSSRRACNVLRSHVVDMMYTSCTAFKICCADCVRQVNHVTAQYDLYSAQRKNVTVITYLSLHTDGMGPYCSLFAQSVHCTAQLRP